MECESAGVDPSKAAVGQVAVGDTDGIVVGYVVFEGRGGHTSLVSDWSSDVCSSDLEVAAALTSNVAEGDPGYSLDLLTGASDKDDGETASLSVANVDRKSVV